MIRNLKIGIALTAALAMSAIGAPGAQAASSLDIGAAPAFLTGPLSGNKLRITGPKEESVAVLTCTTANLDATTTFANLTEVTFAPNFGAANTCKLVTEVVSVASVDVNGCNFTLTNTATTLVWKADVVCPAGKVMEVTQGACTVTIAPQSNLEKITMATVAGTPTHVSATFAITNMSVTGGAGCPAATQGVHTADLTGVQTIKAFRDEGGKEGVQVNLEAT